MRNSAFMPAKGHGNIMGFFILDPVFKPRRAVNKFCKTISKLRNKAIAAIPFNWHWVLSRLKSMPWSLNVLHIFHDFYSTDCKNKIMIAVTSHGVCVCTLYHTCVPGGRQNSKKNKFVQNQRFLFFHPSV